MRRGYSRQLHAHEHPGHEEAEEDADEADEEQQEAVELGDVGCVGAVQDDEAQAPHGEEEAGGQALHDVLAVHSVQTDDTHNESPLQRTHTGDSDVGHLIRSLVCVREVSVGVGRG